MSAHAEKSPIHRIYWLYLFAVHAAYALILTTRFDWLGDSNTSFAGFAFPEWASMLDLVLLPTLIYMFCARKNKLQAVLGGLSMAALGLFAMRLWYPADQMSSALTGLIALRQQLTPFIWLLVGVFEIYVLLLIFRQLRKPMKEGAIELMLAPLIASLGANSKIVRWFAAEQRMWIYGLSKTLPKATDFAGAQHFTYALQNGNASTWYGFFIANTVPIPILHFVLAAFSQPLAWSVTVLTALSSFWLWAEYRATQARPISIDANTLYLRYGTLTDLQIDRANIRAVRLLSWRDFEASAPGKPRPIVFQGMGAATIELTLLDGRVYRVGVDDPVGLVRALDVSAPV
jgi:hypothetical protein